MMAIHLTNQQKGPEPMLQSRVNQHEKKKIEKNKIKIKPRLRTETDT